MYRARTKQEPNKNASKIRWTAKAKSPVQVAEPAGPALPHAMWNDFSEPTGWRGGAGGGRLLCVCVVCVGGVDNTAYGSKIEVL